MALHAPEILRACSGKVKEFTCLLSAQCRNEVKITGKLGLKLNQEIPADVAHFAPILHFHHPLSLVYGARHGL